MDQLRSHDDRHAVLELEIQFFKEKIRQNHAEMKILRRSICLFVERFDKRLDREIRQRQKLRDALFRLFREINQSIESFLAHEIDH